MPDFFDRLKVALADRYELIRELGAGGMAVVYLAHDSRHDRELAVKVLRPELAAVIGPVRFLQEIKVTAKLQHPNILPLHDSGEADSFLYYVMPYVEGEPLRARLSREGALPLTDAVRIMREVVDALAYAHEHGVVHRDIKPDNVLLSSRHAMVTDFGVAKAVSEATGQEKLTTAGIVIGTPAYMAPEQAAGDVHVDQRADIYAVGTLAYELVTGQPPFTGSTAQQLLAAHISNTPEPLHTHRAEVPPALEHAIMKCLEKRPEDRWQTADEILPLLEELGTPSGAVAAGIGMPESQPARRKVIATGLAVAVPLVLLGGWFVATLGGSGSAPPRVTSTRPLTSLPGLETSPSWAPNGTRLAYVSDEAGNLDVWVQQLAAREQVNITPDHLGDDWHPVWSPDGEWIAFFSDRDGGGLHIVPAIGAAPRRIWDAAGGLDLESGLAWSPDGTRLAFSIGPSLYIIPARGGAAEQVSLPREIVRWKIIDISWAPTSERITFVARAAAGLSTSTIWSVTAEGDDAVRVTSGESFDRNPIWTRDGSGIYFVSDRAGTPDLWYVAVDARGRPRGEPATLTVGASVGAFALSEDGRQIAYARQTMRSNIWSLPILDRVVTMDDAQRITDENHFIELLALSPDGQRLAFDSDRSGNADIWTIGIDGTGLRQITSDRAHDWAPRWSPDGEAIGYHSLRTGNRDLWMQPVRGGIPVQLTDHEAQDWTISWSPDGATIVFGSGRSGAVELWRMPATGGEATQLTTIGAVWWYPVWSPDGQWIAFSSDVTGYAEVYVVPAGGGEERQLTNNRWQKGFPIAFSADGTTIYACGNTTAGLERLDVWAIAVADGSARQLTDLSGTRRELFNATTDGRRIYATFLERVGDLWMVEVAR